VAHSESLRQDPHARELKQKVQSLKAVQVEQAVVDKSAKLSFQLPSFSAAESPSCVSVGMGLDLLGGVKILIRAKQPAMDMDRTEHQLTCLLIPERGRLAPLMKSDKPLAPTEMWLAIADLHSLSVVQPFTVLYLPCYRIPVAFGGQSLCGDCKGLLFIAFP
jgi:hypothetical protein